MQKGKHGRTVHLKSGVEKGRWEVYSELLQAFCWAVEVASEESPYLQQSTHARAIYCNTHIMLRIVQRMPVCHHRVGHDVSELYLRWAGFLSGDISSCFT